MLGFLTPDILCKFHAGPQLKLSSITYAGPTTWSKDIKDERLSKVLWEREVAWLKLASMYISWYKALAAGARLERACKSISVIRVLGNHMHSYTRADSILYRTKQVCHANAQAVYLAAQSICTRTPPGQRLTCGVHALPLTCT